VDDNPETPRSEGGNTKYTIIGLLLLLGGGVGIYAATRPTQVTPPPSANAGPDAGIMAPPPTPTVGATIELPPDEPDAAVAPANTNNGAPRIRYVNRYVDACPGTLTDPAGVQRVAQSNFGALRACYERELRVNPQLRGGLTARMMINTAGHVQDVNVSTRMNSRPLVECVKAQLRRLTVPPSRGGCANYDLSYNFSPRE
jgi:hypothetical protein